MNFFVHLFLSQPTDYARIGNTLGDFAKGDEESLLQLYPGEVVEGIMHHRHVDAFADKHPLFLEAKEVLRPNHGRFSGIIVDVLFDHLLHQFWEKFSSEDKEQFIADCYSSLSIEIPNTPERYNNFAAAMIKYDILGSYNELDDVDYVLARIGERFKRKTSLNNALADIEQNYDKLANIFQDFFQDLCAAYNH